MDNECNRDRKWYLFIAVDLAIFFGGLILILIWLIVKRYCCRKTIQAHVILKEEEQNDRHKPQSNYEGVKDEWVCFAALRFYIGELLSSQFLPGKIILLVSTIAASVSTCLYLYEIYDATSVLERCAPFKNWVYCVDFGCNLLFLLHFLLRFTASSSKIEFWFNIYSIVDIFTIPQVLMAIILYREWYGLRFLRIVSLTKLHMVLQNFNLIKSCTSIRVINLISLFVCIWIGGAGFMHLLENSGELTFQSEYKDQKQIGFGTCLYFIVVTLSTVGYGDIGAQTTFGRIFVTFFILVGLAIFASFIPEICEFIYSQSSYSGKYDKERGRKHVIVCGHINFDSVSSFLADFFHEDRSNTSVEVVFINKQEPQEDLKGLLKSYFIQVKYFQGTVMNHHDLDRVQMSNADACLILANQNCLHPNDEDAANIMRAISFKNYSHATPVIIQLLQFENKVYLENIPTWTKRNGDQIICYSEIELGILAQSCLVPGFSTLLTNLFSVRSEEGCGHFLDSHNWLKDYMRGTTMEIYSSPFSPFFESMSYKETVAFCFKNLNLLLIAIEITEKNGKKSLLINPIKCKRMSPNTVGYFICDSYKDASNAFIYCSVCHSSVRDLQSLAMCKCKKIVNDDLGQIICREKTEECLNFNENKVNDSFDAFSYIDGEKMKKIGRLYTCQSQKLSKCVIMNENQAHDLKDHIILCVFSEQESPLIGIKNFLTPLRSTSIPEHQLKDLLIIADKDFIEREWLEISSFPKLKVVFHTFSLRRITHLLAIERCSRCVILNAKTNFRDLQNDLYMVDKEIIIANLYFQAALRKNQRKENAPSSEMELIEAQGIKDHVPLISKLAIEGNVQFLDAKESNAVKIPNYLRKPFAYGYVFTANMLDSLLSTAYFSPNAISIMETLITGGSLRDAEEADDDQDDENINRPLNRIKIELIPVTDFKNILKEDNTVFYRDLFMEALYRTDSICIGLYRKRHLLNQSSRTISEDRFVITNPPANYSLDKSDLVYCLKQICESSDDPKWPPLCDGSHL